MRSTRMAACSLKFFGSFSLACCLAVACGPAVDIDDSDSEGSTSMLGSSTGQASGGSTSTPGSSTGNTTDDPTSSQGTSAAATTDDPTTAESSSSGGSQGCDPFPVEDTACALEGEVCSTDCTDQCEFCNAFACDDGVWSRIEVFPADCLDCGPLCDLVLPAGCAGGPPNTEICVAGCEQGIAGECAAEFSATRACAGAEPAFVCSDETRPEIAGCEAEYDAFYACMGL